MTELPPLAAARPIAADPGALQARAVAAVAKDGDPAAFARLVARPQPSAAPGSAATLRPPPHSLPAPVGSDNFAGDVGMKFEAAVLVPFLAAMLPPEDSPVWGGSAGKLWRGLFAEELAAATAGAGGVGIAPMIDAMIANRR